MSEIKQTGRAWAIQKDLQVMAKVLQAAPTIEVVEAFEPDQRRKTGAGSQPPSLPHQPDGVGCNRRSVGLYY